MSCTHTGPQDDYAGEMRRPSLSINFAASSPDPEWRPDQENPRFLKASIDGISYPPRSHSYDQQRGARTHACRVETHLDACL